jgi:hypothetical protein
MLISDKRRSRSMCAAVGRGVWLAAALAAPALPLLAGCPGTIDDKERFAKKHDGGTGECGDVPALLAQSCGAKTCHAADVPSASLDLASPGVETRVAGRPSTQCSGLLADPASPESSVLYTKLTAQPVCGTRMPLGSTPLKAEQIACVAEWISGLSAPDAGDGGCMGCLCVPGTEEACYSGPAGTDGVGPCLGGKRTCNTEGTSWGPCMGEVLPAFDACDTPADEDCDGAMTVCTDVWSRLFGDPNGQYARAVAVDSSNNVVITGQFEGTVNFGGGPLTAVGYDAYVAKYDRYGTHRWSKRFGDAGNQFGMAVALDAAGNIFVAGRVFTGIDLGGGMLRTNGGDDVFVAKLDPDGNHLWSKIFGGDGADRCDRITVDAAGNVIVAGAFSAAANFGGTQLTSAGMRDVFVAKLGPNGNVVFARRAGGSGDDLAYGAAADATGNVLVTGTFAGSLDFGGPQLTSDGESDVFVAKLDPGGQHVWSARFGGPGADEAQDVAVNQTTGEVVLTGTFTSTVDFSGQGEAVMTSAGDRDIFVAKLDPAGAHLFSQRFGDAQDQLSTEFETGARTSVALDASGNIVLSGTLFGAADFGGGTLTSAGRTDIYLAKLDPTGAYRHSALFGDSSTQIGLDVATDGNYVVLVGRAYGRTNFGQGALMHAGQGDAFMAKLELP